MGRVLTPKYTVDVGASMNANCYICYWNGRVYYVSNGYIESCVFTAAGGFGAVVERVPQTTGDSIFLCTDGNYLYASYETLNVMYLRAFDLVTLDAVGNAYAVNILGNVLNAPPIAAEDGYIYVDVFTALSAYTFNGTSFTKAGNSSAIFSTLHGIVKSGADIFLAVYGGIADEVQKGTFNGTNFSFTGYSIETSARAIAVDASYVYILYESGRLYVRNRGDMTSACEYVDITTGFARAIALDGTYIYCYTTTGVYVYQFTGGVLVSISSLIYTGAQTGKMIFADDHLIIANDDDLYALRMDLTAQFTVNSQSGKVGDTFTFTAI